MSNTKNRLKQLISASFECNELRDKYPGSLLLKQKYVECETEVDACKADLVSEKIQPVIDKTTMKIEDANNAIDEVINMLKDPKSSINPTPSKENDVQSVIDAINNTHRAVLGIKADMEQNTKEIIDKIEVPYWDPKSIFSPYNVRFEGEDLNNAIMKVDNWQIPLSRDQLLQAIVVAICMKHSKNPIKERGLSELMISDSIINSEWHKADSQTKSKRHIYWIFTDLNRKLAKNGLISLFKKNKKGWCILTMPPNITISQSLKEYLIISKSILPLDDLIALNDNS